MKHFIFLIISSIFIVSCIQKPKDPTPGVITEHKALPEGTKICVIGDSGKKTDGQRKVAEALQTENCDQIRHTGDVIYNDGISSPEDPEFKARFLDYYTPLMDAKVPFYMSMGNHDYHQNPSAWLEIANQYKYINFPSMYYMQRYGDFCFITLDTNSAYFDQFSWRKKIKEKYSDKCKMTIAFGHHPRYSSGKHGDANVIVAKYLEKMVEGSVDAYIAGHEHNQEDYGKVDGTHYLVTGTAGEYRFINDEPPVWAQARLGYMVFTVHHKNNSPYIKYYFFSVDEDSGKKVLEHYGVVRGHGFRK